MKPHYGLFSEQAGLPWVACPLCGRPMMRGQTSRKAVNTVVYACTDARCKGERQSSSVDKYFAALGDWPTEKLLAVVEQVEQFRPDNPQVAQLACRPDQVPIIVWASKVGLTREMAKAQAQALVNARVKWEGELAGGPYCGVKAGQFALLRISDVAQSTVVWVDGREVAGRIAVVRASGALSYAEPWALRPLPPDGHLWLVEIDPNSSPCPVPPKEIGPWKAVDEPWVREIEIVPASRPPMRFRFRDSTPISNFHMFWVADKRIVIGSWVRVEHDDGTTTADQVMGLVVYKDAPHVHVRSGTYHQLEDVTFTDPPANAPRVIDNDLAGADLGLF